MGNGLANFGVYILNIGYSSHREYRYNNREYTTARGIGEEGTVSEKEQHSNNR